MSIFDPFAPNTNALLGAALSGGDPMKLARMMVGEKGPAMLRFLENDDGPELDEAEVRTSWPGALESLSESGTVYAEDDVLFFEPDHPAHDLVSWDEDRRIWESVS